VITTVAASAAELNLTDTGRLLGRGGTDFLRRHLAPFCELAGPPRVTPPH